MRVLFQKVSWPRHYRVPDAPTLGRRIGQLRKLLAQLRPNWDDRIEPGPSC